MILLSHGRHTNSFGPMQVVPLCAAPADATQTAGGPAAVDAERHRVRRPGHVDLVCQPVRRRQPRVDRRPGPRRRRDHALHQELRRVLQLLEPVQPRTRGAAARERAEGVRVAVRLRHQPSRARQNSGPRGGQRGRLPGDRRRVRVRRPLWGAPRHISPTCAPRSALPIRLGSPPSPTYTTTPPSPTRSSSARMARSSTRPRCTGRTSATRVDTVYANTYISNRVYGRPIFPLGQTYSKPSAEELVRFREEAPLYGATGTSFWDFQETPASLWTALATPLAPLSERHAQPLLVGTRRRQQRRPGAVDAGAPRRRDPRPGNDRHLQRRDQNESGTVPERTRDRAQRSHRSGHLAGAAGPHAGRGRLDRRRTKG